MAEVLRHIPKANHPDLLVGIETSDDAGVFRLSDSLAIVQTIDFFTPIVDDPIDYGRIAAANSLSDVYAMGGRPITALGVACFDPDSAPAEVWSSILKGMGEAAAEAGVVILGGHTVKDPEPKFGLAVTGIIDPERMFTNDLARPGDNIYLSKRLGTGIVTTAAKADQCPANVLEQAIASMRTLNSAACEAALEAGVRCATDITGFGLVGHLYNIAVASGVRIELEGAALPMFYGIQALVEAGMVTGAAEDNASNVGERFVCGPGVSEVTRQVALDPQTSGGLAMLCRRSVGSFPRIGCVVEGEPGIYIS